MSLAMSLTAFAQSGTTSGSMDNKMDHKKMDSKKDDKMMMGKKMSMTGCIMEKDGKYMMMDKKHPDGVMLMSSEDLKPHVGHKVKVKGMMQEMSASDSMGSSDMSSSGGAMKSDSSSGSMGSGHESASGSMKSDNNMHSGMSMMSMKVDKMQMKSEHCDMDKMNDKMMKH